MRLHFRLSSNPIHFLKVVDSNDSPDMDSVIELSPEDVLLERYGLVQDPHIDDVVCHLLVEYECLMMTCHHVKEGVFLAGKYGHVF